MNKKFKIIIIAAIVVGFLTIAFLYLRTTNIQVLNPKGPIALKERDLIYTALALALIVVIPVYGLAIGFAWRYREGNHKAKYSPNLAGNRLAETTWWLIPTAIISVLAVITWRATHALDPYKPIASSTPPITIQVVALDWKWLFIYPQQNIASVNYFQFPSNTPLDFDITSDTVMNSFWIPQLGGQIYAMPGMSTELHLMATSYGAFYGSSANISGSGFAGMNFLARSSSRSAFNAWVSQAKKSTKQLSLEAYNQLAQPSSDTPPSVYKTPANGLYLSIINKYMAPGQQMTGVGMSQMAGMDAQ